MVHAHARSVSPANFFVTAALSIARHRVLSGVATGVLVGALLVLGGCRRPPAAFAPPPAPEVGVAEPVKRKVAQTLEFTGVTRGIETVEIRARVRGFLETKAAQDGKRVKRGDVLFTIDPRAFEAALAQAKAELAARQSELRLAEVTLERTQQAVASNAVSKIDLDRAVAQRDGAIAQVDLAKARVRTAELDLEYTQVRSPITGRLGFVTVEVGDLVGATEPTLLARVINDERVYATYDMDERTILESRKANQNKRPGEDGRPNLVVRLGLSNEVGFPHEGTFERADNAVNPLTGTIKVESVFDNKDGTILPGAFVRVQPVFGEKDVLTVPDVAVMSDQRGRFVLVVGKENKVERRDVRVGEVIDRQRVVLEGLEGTEKVIVNGLQRARQGIEVKVASGERAG
jgi:RND family efflux transporter MFP subunit